MLLRRDTGTHSIATTTQTTINQCVYFVVCIVHWATGYVCGESNSIAPYRFTWATDNRNEYNNWSAARFREISGAILNVVTWSSNVAENNLKAQKLMKANPTHGGRDEMAAISQTTFWNEFSWIKICDIRLIFHCNLFLRVPFTIFQHWFR